MGYAAWRSHKDMTFHSRKSTTTIHSSMRERRVSRQKKKEGIYNQKTEGLPLSGKCIYVDVKHGKSFLLLEEQLKKLGAKIETFLSCDVNYVISTSAPARVEENVGSNNEENPKSPSFVPSPFSCGPSPTGGSETKRTVTQVSRGKTMAQIAFSKNQTNSIVDNALKMGIKIVSVDVAHRWLEKELKKIEQEIAQEKIETEPGAKQPLKKEKEKTGKSKRSKPLKGSFIKFESSNLQYRPVKSELPRWPKLNLLAPPGICPFGEAQLKVQHKFGPRKPFSPEVKDGDGDNAVADPLKESFRKIAERPLSPEVIPAPADVVGVPVVTTGDIKCNLRNHAKQKANKGQGFCDCCKMRFQDFNKHVNSETHQAFARDKSNYEGLDRVISELPSTISFLQSVLVRHCVKKQSESCQKDSENKTGWYIPQVPEPPVSPLTTDKTRKSSLDIDLQLHHPLSYEPELSVSKQQDQELLSNKESLQEEEKVYKASGGDDRPHAVVIRKPVASGLFTSPRRRQPTPSKRPRVQECSLVFRDSPMASLQPSSCSNSGTSFLFEDSSFFSQSMSTNSAQRLARDERSVNKSLSKLFESSSQDSKSLKQANEGTSDVTPLKARPRRMGVVNLDSAFRAVENSERKVGNVKSSPEYNVSVNVIHAAEVEKSLENSQSVVSSKVDDLEKSISVELTEKNLSLKRLSVEVVRLPELEISSYPTTEINMFEEVMSAKAIESAVVVPTIADRVKQRTRSVENETLTQSPSKQRKRNVSECSPDYSIHEGKVSSGKKVDSDKKQSSLAKKKTSNSVSKHIEDSASKQSEISPDYNIHKRNVTSVKEIDCDEKHSSPAKKKPNKSNLSNHIGENGSKYTAIFEQDTCLKDIKEHLDSVHDKEDFLESADNSQNPKQNVRGGKKHESPVKQCPQDEPKEVAPTIKSAKDISPNESIATSLKRRSRTCKLFVPEGYYANSGEGTDLMELAISAEAQEGKESSAQSFGKHSNNKKRHNQKHRETISVLQDEDSNDVGNIIVVPNIAERVKRRSRAVSSVLDDTEHCMMENELRSKNVEVCQEMENLQEDKGEIKNPSDCKEDKDQSKNIKDIVTEDKSENDLSLPVVPNIAESVKKRRSCTMFNGGHGSEHTPVKTGCHPSYRNNGTPKSTGKSKFNRGSESEKITGPYSVPTYNIEDEAFQNDQFSSLDLVTSSYPPKGNLSLMKLSELPKDSSTPVKMISHQASALKAQNCSVGSDIEMASDEDRAVKSQIDENTAVDITPVLVARRQLLQQRRMLKNQSENSCSKNLSGLTHHEQVEIAKSRESRHSAPKEKNAVDVRKHLSSQEREQPILDRLGLQDIQEVSEDDSQKSQRETRCSSKTREVFSSPRRSSSESRKKSKDKHDNGAAVVRRRKTCCINNKGGEADWSRYHSKTDWSQQTNEVVDMSNPNKRKPEASVMKESKSALPSSPIHSRHRSTTETNVSNSPRLLLRLKRNSYDDEFSSTLEERYDGQDFVPNSSSSVQMVPTLQQKNYNDDKEMGNMRECGSIEGHTDEDSVKLLSSPCHKTKRNKRRRSEQVEHDSQNESELDKNEKQAQADKKTRKKSQAKKRRRLEFSEIVDEFCRQNTGSYKKSKKMDKNSLLSDSHRAQQSALSSVLIRISPTKPLTLCTDAIPHNPPSPVFKVSPRNNREKKSLHQDKGQKISIQGNPGSSADSPTVNTIDQQKTASNVKDNNNEPAPNENGKDDASGSGESSTKKVKLADRWKLISDRSVARIFMSDPDSTPFEGFQGSSQGLPSDASFIETSEVEITNENDKEWVIKEASTGDQEKSDNTIVQESANSEAGADNDQDVTVNGIEDLLPFLPNFSSPGKAATDSSWGDICESYLSTSVTLQGQSPYKTRRQDQRASVSNNQFSPFTSPKKFGSPRRKCTTETTPKKHVSPGMESIVNNLLSRITPKKGKSPSLESNSIVLPVDDVISFNYLSPQRLKFSPVRDRSKKSLPKKPNFS